MRVSSSAAVRSNAGTAHGRSRPRAPGRERSSARAPGRAGNSGQTSRTRSHSVITASKRWTRNSSTCLVRFALMSNPRRRITLVQRPSLSKQIAVLPGDVGDAALKGVKSQREAQLMRLGLLRCQVQPHLSRWQGHLLHAQRFEQACFHQIPEFLLGFLWRIGVPAQVSEPVWQKPWIQALQAGHRHLAKAEKAVGFQGESHGYMAVNGSCRICCRGDFGVEIAVGFVEVLQVALHLQHLIGRERLGVEIADHCEQFRLGEDGIAVEGNGSPDVLGALDNFDRQIHLGRGGRRCQLRHDDGGLQEAL